MLPAAAVPLCALAAGARCLWRHRPSFEGPSLRQHVAAHRESRDSTAEHKRWLTEMRQNPQRRRYAERIDAGDLYRAWPERVEYDLDVNATASCRHLAPLESRMRGAGIDKLHGPMTLYADCLIDETALRLRHRLPSSVGYTVSSRLPYGHSRLCSACDLAGQDATAAHPPVAFERCALVFGLLHSSDPDDTMPMLPGQSLYTRNDWPAMQALGWRVNPGVPSSALIPTPLPPSTYQPMPEPGTPTPCLAAVGALVARRRMR